jgi:hypothetical protein
MSLPKALKTLTDNSQNSIEILLQTSASHRDVDREVDIYNLELP